ncbi:SPFH domain-containing protein [Streptomyces sp. NPDC002793]|uniref:SPFH domain-containing protein n=1 Tax=Streptomyces sp. NPDC002793 TaxID=3154432 RepID=UPI00332C1FDB
MRSTENVRGEWDELGERDTRVLLPGPGARDLADLAPPVAEPERETEPAGTAAEVSAVEVSMVEVSAVVVDDDVPVDLGPALDAVAGVGRPAPADGWDPAGLDLTPDPDPEPDPEPDPDPEGRREAEPVSLVRAPGPVPAPAAPDPGAEQAQVPEPLEPAPVDAPPPVPEVEPVPAGRGSGPEGGPPDLREPAPVEAADPVAWWGAGRRQPVITAETTAPIPVHLLFRDDGRTDREDIGDGRDRKPSGAGTVRRPADRRPPLPRSPRAQGPTRPAPLADPRLAERPGPALPGWSALLTAVTGSAAALAVLAWHGVLPAAVTGRLGLGARPYDGIGTGAWALLALLVAVVVFALCGLGRGRAGHASVLTLFGDYRGSVRRTGLLWVSPLLRRRRIDVRLRHWRSEPLPAVDASGTALRAVVLVVWQVKDTARAVFGVADHERYLSDQVEAALARVLSQLPADAFHEDSRTLRDAEAVGDALTRMVRADCAPVGIEVYSAQPTGIEYAPEVAAAMQRCRVAAIDAKHRDGVLTAVVDAVDDTVGRLTARGIVELDAYEHKALVRDLTVAFYTGRSLG